MLTLAIAAALAQEACRPFHDKYDPVYVKICGQKLRIVAPDAQRNFEEDKREGSVVSYTMSAIHLKDYQYEGRSVLISRFSFDLDCETKRRWMTSEVHMYEDEGEITVSDRSETRFQPDRYAMDEIEYRYLCTQGAKAQ